MPRGQDSRVRPVGPWRLPKAADLDDDAMLLYIDDAFRAFDAISWVNVFDLWPTLPAPWPVFCAKARRLVTRGLLDGCPCGQCRGDLWLTEAGRARVQDLGREAQRSGMLRV